MPTTRRRDGDIDRRVGARLKFIRLERGLSQEKLGDAMGLTFQQIQKYEKGSNAVASSRIPLLCQVLKIKPNDLFDGHAFQADAITGDTVAIDIGIRVAKLGTKARRAMLAFLELAEGNNNSKKNRGSNAATRTSP